MTRTIQTALNAFPSILELPRKVPVQVWPDLREAHDAICNKGISRAGLAERFPQFDFTECSEHWDYPAHAVEAATSRAERVRARLEKLSSTHRNIVVISHRGFIAFLVHGSQFDVCE
ncbi:uncharacterized protein K489DRAFT_424965 [Dissoconium aciculare CBS 342.82]|uniref:Phosphoglycerate mutase-like protein n=1 Tax=Dissoconium aciculare CBS 342.82 TaxID=1314786 RepID=A0A6J3M4X3_9PEZI|nr:uncharacterized protein K489DRAFT_424965 [Dissoconium aciculare CBS 342.82]KAF1823080.1 hypothetical protein K489DRAFT_424965 [Dissoconium aciculare CBS 342.82]